MIESILSGFRVVVSVTGNPDDDPVRVPVSLIAATEEPLNARRE